MRLKMKMPPSRLTDGTPSPEGARVCLLFKCSKMEHETNSCRTDFFFIPLRVHGKVVILQAENQSYVFPFK